MTEPDTGMYLYRNAFDRVPLYHRQTEETSDLMDMGQISIAEEENDFSLQEETVIVEEEPIPHTEEEAEKDEAI